MNRPIQRTGEAMARHKEENTMSKRKNITGRDGYLVFKALAYAVETIDQLPPRWQEFSDMNDMKKMLEESLTAEQVALFRDGARSHIRQVEREDA